VAPSLPRVPPVTGEKPSLPTLPLPSLPLPLPGSPGGSGAGDTSTGDGAPKSAPSFDITICLPPLATLGDC
jgi:hypothetical protein